MKVIISFAVLLFIAQSNIETKKSTNKITFYEEIDKTQDSFLEHIPVGTSLSEAKEILKKNKLKFEIYLNQDFTNKIETLKGKDFLYVDKRKSRGWVSRRWQVAIIYENDTVTDIFVSYGLIGL